MSLRGEGVLDMGTVAAAASAAAAAAEAGATPHAPAVLATSAELSADASTDNPMDPTTDTSTEMFEIQPFDEKEYILHLPRMPTYKYEASRAHAMAHTAASLRAESDPKSDASAVSVAAPFASTTHMKFAEGAEPYLKEREAGGEEGGAGGIEGAGEGGEPPAKRSRGGDL